MSNFVECDKHWKYLVYTNLPLFNLQFVITFRVPTWRGEALSRAMTWGRHVRGGAWSSLRYGVSTALHSGSPHDWWVPNVLYIYKKLQWRSHAHFQFVASHLTRKILRQALPTLCVHFLSIWHYLPDPSPSVLAYQNWSTDGVKKYRTDQQTGWRNTELINRGVKKYRTDQQRGEEIAELINRGVKK